MLPPSVDGFVVCFACQRFGRCRQRAPSEIPTQKTPSPLSGQRTTFERTFSFEQANYFCQHDGIDLINKTRILHFYWKRAAIP